MRRFLAPSSGLDKFFAAQFSAGYITNMSGFDLRQAQADAPQSADVTLDRDIIGWIGEDEIAPLSLQQPFETVSVSRISAQQAVATEQPEIAKNCCRRCRIGDLLSVSAARAIANFPVRARNLFASPSIGNLGNSLRQLTLF
jgi:hypothetical protein